MAARVAEKALQKACERADGALASSVLWRSGCWQEKLSLVKSVLENMQNNTRQEVSLEFDPVKALSDQSIVQAAESTKSLSDSQLMELEAISSL